jgi:hypothetical protein
MATRGLGDGKEDTKPNNHAEGREPVMGADPMTFMNRHNSEYKDELSRDDGLDQAQASRPQRLDLKGEPADHAGNADKPHGPTQQVTHETPIELHVG